MISSGLVPLAVESMSPTQRAKGAQGDRGGGIGPGGIVGSGQGAQGDPSCVGAASGVPRNPGRAAEGAPDADDGEDVACQGGDHVWLDIVDRGAWVEQECQFCGAGQRLMKGR